jgi:hypothetical protein
MFEKLRQKFQKRSTESMLCPVCGGTSVYEAAVGDITLWEQQLGTHAEWKRKRGLDVTAPAPVSRPDGQNWALPAFDEQPPAAAGAPPPRHRHMRCSTCWSLLPPPFLEQHSKRVLMITTGMPEAGKTTWIRCLFEPQNPRYLIVEPTTAVARRPYRYVEPYTVANVDPRSALPFLLHSTDISFQSRTIPIAGVDIKGETFRDRETMPDKYHTVEDIVNNVRSMRFDEFLMLFVVPFTASGTERYIGQLANHLINPTKDNKRMWQGIIWTHLDSAVLRDEAALRSFSSDAGDAAESLVTAALSKKNPFDHTDWERALAQLRKSITSHDWSGSQELLESLTWLLFQLMRAYSEQRLVTEVGKVELYFEYGDGLGKRMVQACSALASTLFASWDNLGRGAFAAMVLEGVRDPHARGAFRVLPCGFAFPQGVDPQSVDPTTLWRDGRPVWGDLLLLEILQFR